MRTALSFVYGMIVMAVIYYVIPAPDLGLTTLSKENAAYLAKAHVQCFETVLASWAIQDSTYIPIDSIEQEYKKTCGAKIDSLMH